MARLGSRAPYVLMALALAGLSVAFYDSYAIYNAETLWCPPPVDGCNVVAASPYARIFGLPIGYYGLVYYAGMLGLAVLAGCDRSSRALAAAAILYAGVGVLCSAYFLYVQVGFIHAFCIYCAISGITTVLLLVAALACRRAVSGG